MAKVDSKSLILSLFNWGCIFAGDLIPYLSVFLITLMVAHLYDTEHATRFNLAYSYSAMILALFAAPGMVSLKRRLAHTEAHGVVLAAGFIIRMAGLLLGGAACFVYFVSTPHLAPLLSIWGLVFVARVLETSVDIPAIVVQYRWSPFEYFVFRLVTLIVLAFILIGFSYLLERGVYQLLMSYVMAALVVAFLAIMSIRSYWHKIGDVRIELRSQLLEIRAMFMAVCVYVASTRLYMVIIGEYWGAGQAAEFATVQNVTAVAGLLASAFAGLFFWSRNRLSHVSPLAHMKSLCQWSAIAIIIGILVGVIVALATEWGVLRPLHMSKDLWSVSWIICMATPLLALQALISNYFMIIKRDKIMLLLALFTSMVSVIIMFGLIPSFGLFGAAIAIVLASSMSILTGVFMIWREIYYAHSSGS